MRINTYLCTNNNFKTKTMFCVHVKSKEFKDACSRLNIHPSSLEVIVFQYLNNIDPRSFPSDEYIMSKLEGKAMTDASESQILLWEKAYSTPKVFSDRASVGAFIKEATKYFSPDSISIHRNNEGNYVAKVTKPENIEAYEKELKRILDTAPRNKQGQLLAPNGKPTKLSERQYAQVRTKAFKKWFGDWTKITQNEDGTWNIPADVSKIIDEETGEPKVVFHGSNNTFTEFKTYHKDKEVGDMFGAYFTKNRKYAEKTYGNKVYEVFLNIKSPLTTEGRWTGVIDEESYKEITTEHDGIINDNFDNNFLNKILRNSRSELIVFNPNQIKSATDNVGTFSTESDDIDYFTNTNRSKIENKRSTEEFYEGKSLSQEDVKELFERFNSSVFLGKIFTKVFEIWKKIPNVNITIKDNLGNPRYLGVSNRVGEIKYKTGLFLEESEDTIAHILLHEVIHSITTYATYAYINKDTEGYKEIYNSLPDNIKKACEDLQNLYDKLDSKKYLKGKYGLKNIHELLAEISNVDFRNDIRTGGFWDNIILIIRKLLNLGDTKGLIERKEDVKKLDNILKEFLNGYNPNIHEEYMSKVYKGEIENSKKNDQFTLDAYDVESSNELETRTQNEEFMENNLALITELENLYDLGLTDTDIKTLGTQLMYWISEHLTVLHNTPGELKRVYNIDKDASTMSRKDIAELVTPKRLMEQCIREYRRPKAGMDWEAVDHLNDIADNARLLLFLSSNTFTTLEGFSIIMPGADFGIMADIDVTTNEFNGTNEDVQIQEEEGSSIEHWIRASTTITLDERISLDVKSAISKCYRIGKDGKPVIKDGIKERITYEEARNIIVNICNGCLKLSDMIEALDKASKDYPWLPQLTEQIRISEDKAVNGARSQLQSAFFRDMYMARNAYSVVKKNGDKFESVIVNENTALKEITSSIITEFTIGSHPLFKAEFDKDARKVYNELVSLYEDIKNVTEITPENRDNIVNALLGIYNNLGFYNITQDLVESIITEDNVKDISSSLEGLLVKLERGYRIQKETGNKYYPFEYSIGKSAPNSVLGNLRAILRIPASKIDNTTAFSVYDNGKMHQSFCTPSYLFKLMTKLGFKDDAKFREFMSNEFDQYPWFAIEQDGKIVYRLSWLQEMQNQETREILKHKIQLNFNKHNYMRNMNSSEYALSVLAEFFCEKSKLKGRDVAWYRVPMLSNKPSSEFIRFVRYTGPTYKDVITHALYEVYSQEMSRIQTVRLRNQHPESVEYISNFDKRGLEFCFLTFLNEHLGTSSELGLLMEQRLNGNTDVINLEEEKVKEAIKKWMNQRSTEIIDNWEANGILEKAVEIANIGSNKFEVKRNIENFIWNDVLASVNIQELTITDPALYKDVEDIQKRIAQMHSPGIRPNVDAVDFEGNEVSDGFHRALVFADFEDVISNVIDNITVICDRRIEIAKAKLKEGEETSVELEEAKAFKELLVGENGLYRQINATDAQAYSCASSYRKKAFMFGKWSRSAEAVYHKLKKGEYVSMSDIQTAFQPLKPFVYSQIAKSSGVKDAPMSKLRIGIQNKNSEYLLIMAEALIQNEDTGKPNLLRAINEFMEETADKFPTRGIDTIEYGSAVKVGKQTRLIDISKATSVEEAKEIMRAHVFKGYKKGTWDTYQVEDPNNPYTEKVDTIPAEDYSIQQEVPAHFRDHQQAEGSQSRAITPSDLPSVDANGNPVTFATGYNIDGTPTGHMSSKEFVQEWEETHAANIDESIDLLVQELKLDSLSKKDRNITIARLLQKEIIANPNRYGTDLLIACSLDANYEFRIPLGDPIQSKRVEQLLNSIVKNRINKQTIAGGPIVQVSNFGTSKQLSIRFNGKDGKVLDSYEEWSSKEENKGKSFDDYKKYIKENQAGVAYMECLAPAYTKELFANFMDENGNVDIEAVEATSPELLKMIGYRIPTEDKYSISPLKIVGFLPRVAGDGIMLPYDITLINGSDFDIDKMYVMFKEYTIKKKKFESKDDTSSLFKGIQSGIYHSILNNRGNNGYNQKEVEEDAKRLAAIFLNKKVKVDIKKRVAAELKSKYEKKWKTTIPDLYQAASKGYRANRYECVEPTSPRAKRNNKIIDMTYAVMTHETTVDKALNPGGFEAQKHAGYLVEAFRKAVIKEKITDRDALIKKFKELSRLSADELKTLAKTKGNLIFIDTQVQFYEQNNAAGALIGIFAVDKVAHAFLGNDNLTYHGLKRGRDFSIDGIQIRNGVEIDPVLNRKGQYIGKILGSLVASAADAVKDPVLNLMNINGTTAATLCTMVRLGIPFETAALFLSSKVIKDCLSIQARENLNKFTTLNDVIKKEMDTLGINSTNTKLNEEDLSEEEMIIGLVNPTDEIKYKTLRVLSSILNINSDVKSLSFPTRMNSMAGAVGPLAIDNLILMHKLNNFPADTFKDEEGNSVNVYSILENHPMLKSFFKANGIAEMLLKDIPANSNAFRGIVNSGGKEFAKTLYGDRKLLSKLSDFYLSYILVSSGVINPKHTVYYVEKFPKFYMDTLRENPELKDNPLIAAIKLDVDRKTKKPVLKVETTGASITYKESLMGGWTELVRDPKTKDLAIHLFMYNFFRGGVVFNPKTFMGLTPYQVKEAIPGYRESYTKVSVSPSEYEHIIDLFIRNNWNETKLVPKIEEKQIVETISKAISENKIGGEISIPNSYKELEGVKYFKVSIGKEVSMWKVLYADENSKITTVQKVDPLGNNSEYLELSKAPITDAITKTTESTEVDDSESAIGDTHLQSSESPSDSYSDEVYSTTTEEMWSEYEKIEHSLSRGRVSLSETKQIEHLVEVGAKHGVTLNSESIKEESEKYC